MPKPCPGCCPWHRPKWLRKRKRRIYSITRSLVCLEPYAFRTFFSTTIYLLLTLIILNSFYKYTSFPWLQYLGFLAHSLDGSRCHHVTVKGTWPVRRVSSHPSSDHRQLCEQEVITYLSWALLILRPHFNIDVQKTSWSPRPALKSCSL